jgi:ATP synthase protein I
MTMNDPEQVSDGGEDPRLTSLDERLQAAHHAEKQRISPKGSYDSFSGKGASQGNRVLSTLIGAPLGAVLIGWLLDRFFGTKPTLMLVMLFLGIAAAFVQIWNISKERAE